MNTVTDAFSEENVQEVAGIVRDTDWRTGLAAVAILLIGLAAVRLISIAVKKGLYGAFAAHGVEMSYPHLNVHMK